MKENGRSMVEMLGVLAVIGVLSIGGIAGYRTAMNYYQGNEIINDVNLRATMVASDIATNGVLVSGLYQTDLGTENTLGQPVTVEPDNGSFWVTVKTVDESTCRNILNRDTDDTPIMEIAVNDTTYDGTGTPCTDTNEIAFLFANDLGDVITLDRIGFDPLTYQGCETSADCGEKICAYGRCLSTEDYCSAIRFASNPTDCETDEHCLIQECVPANCASDVDCTSATKPYCQKFQENSATYSMCVECTKNSDCNDENFYCGAGYNSCYQSTVNRCYPVELKQTVTGEDSFTTGGKTYYISKKEMSWWDAENFCKALGKSLVPADILNAKADGTTAQDDGTNQTALVDELYTGFNHSSFVWTATDYGTSTSASKTCFAYKVYLSTGELRYNGRGSDARALCW